MSFIKDDTVYLKSILLSMDKIAEHQSSGSKENTIRDAIIYNLATIGEATTKISLALRDKYPEVPWRKIIANRNILIHEYLGVDHNMVANTVKYHLPELRIQIETIIRKEEGKNHG